MQQTLKSRILILLGTALLAAAGLGALLMFMEYGPGSPAPAPGPKKTAPVASPSPGAETSPSDVISEDMVIARVDDQAIRYGDWREAALLDQVIDGLVGQPAPSGSETLQRLINEVLVLRAVSPEATPTAEEVDEKINSLEQAWNVNAASVAEALEAVGFDRAAFERSIRRLLMVQAGLDRLEAQGRDPQTWLEEQRANADIQIVWDVAELPLSTTPSAVEAEATSAPASTAEGELALPSLAPATETPTSTSAPPTHAPDFILERAGGGTFTLTEQLTEGPVVLVFFEKCG